MKFRYDLTGAEPIIRDMRVYHSTGITNGTPMVSGVNATAELCGTASPAVATTVQAVIGVIQETLTAAQALSVVAEGVDMYAKVCINPLAIYRAKYSQAAADDTVTSTETANTLTGTSVTHHERGWAYVTNVGSTTGGYGNLFQIGSSTGTTAIVGATTYPATVATNTSDTFIVLPAPFSADVEGGGIDLATNLIDLSGYAGTGAGGIMIVENYIDSKQHAMEILRADKHSGNNYSDLAPKFYADLHLSDNVFLSGGETGRPIV